MQLRVFTEPQEGATYAQLAKLARHAESCGFDAFFRSDHYQTTRGDGLPGPTDSWITLAGLAVETSTIRLGTLVSSATFRLPGPLAISVAQVDAMSGGRVELGLGTGWYEAEHTAYGIPFPPLGERFDRLEEQLAIVTGLWRTPLGEQFSFAGTHYQLTDSPALPKPVQPAGPPIIIGGGGPRRTPDLAARFADGFNVISRSVEVASEQFGRVRDVCARIGRATPPTFSIAHTVVCGRTDADITRRGEAAWDDIAVLREKGLAGTPDQVAARLRAYAEIGAEHAYLRVSDITDLDHLDLIAAEVMPQV